MLLEEKTSLCFMTFPVKYHKHTKVVILQLLWNIILLKNKKSKQDKKPYHVATLR